MVANTNEQNLVAEYIREFIRSAVTDAIPGSAPGSHEIVQVVISQDVASGLIVFELRIYDPDTREKVWEKCTNDYMDLLDGATMAEVVLVLNSLWSRERS